MWEHELFSYCQSPIQVAMASMLNCFSIASIFWCMLQVFYLFQDQ